MNILKKFNELYAKLIMESIDENSSSAEILEEFKKARPDLKYISKMLIYLSIFGMSDKTNELLELLSKSPSNIEKIPDDNIEQFNKVLSILEDLDNIVSFNDFTSLLDIKLITGIVDLEKVCGTSFIKSLFSQPCEAAEKNTNTCIKIIEKDPSKLCDKAILTILNNYSNPISDNALEKILDSFTFIPIIARIAERPNLPEKIIRRLVKDDDERIKRVLVEKANLPKDILIKMVDDENAHICFMAMKRLKMHLTKELAEKILKGGYREDCKKLVKMPEFPQEFFEKIADDNTDPYIQYAILSRNDFPKDLIEKLAHNGTTWVRRKARERLKAMKTI